MILCDLSLFPTSGKARFGCKGKVITSPNFNILKSYMIETYGLRETDYYLLCNGKKVDFLSENLSGVGTSVTVVPRTLGGKGGFGSMLRAIGAQIEKTTNREACRDLSGRRLRDINEEQRLKNWISQQAEREREAAERKKRKLERLCQEPKHDFKDDQYDQNRSLMTEEMSSSIELGLKASSSGTAKLSSKRKDNETSLKGPPVKKKKTLWLDEADSSSSSDEELSSTTNEEKKLIC